MPLRRGWGLLSAPLPASCRCVSDAAVAFVAASSSDSSVSLLALQHALHLGCSAGPGGAAPSEAHSPLGPIWYGVCSTRVTAPCQGTSKFLHHALEPPGRIPVAWLRAGVQHRFCTDLLLGSRCGTAGITLWQAWWPEGRSITELATEIILWARSATNGEEPAQPQAPACPVPCLVRSPGSRWPTCKAITAWCCRWQCYHPAASPQLRAQRMLQAQRQGPLGLQEPALRQGPAGCRSRGREPAWCWGAPPAAPFWSGTLVLL